MQNKIYFLEWRCFESKLYTYYLVVYYNISLNLCLECNGYLFININTTMSLSTVGT